MEHRMNDPRGYDEGECHHHHGFKMVLPMLAVPVVFGVMRGIARHQFGRGYMHMRHGGEGDENFVPPFFAELHRRAHAAEAKAAAQQPSAAEPKATPPQPPTVES